jgi:hypothetical protein
MPAVTYDTTLPFSFPAVSRKPVTAAFDGGRLTSDGSVMLLALRCYGYSATIAFPIASAIQHDG